MRNTRDTNRDAIIGLSTMLGFVCTVPMFGVGPIVAIAFALLATSSGCVVADQLNLWLASKEKKLNDKPVAKPESIRRKLESTKRKLQDIKRRRLGALGARDNAVRKDNP